jgi:hypothetical protein
MYASVFLQCSNALTHTLIMGVDTGKSQLKAGRAGFFSKSGCFLQLDQYGFGLNRQIQPKPMKLIAKI